MAFGSTVDIKRQHGMSIEQVYYCAETIANAMKNEYFINWYWDKNSIVFNSSSGVANGTKGKLDIDDKEIHIVINLPIILYALKGSIEESVKEKLVELFGY